jgi:ribosomal protein S15P/S13E
MSYELHSSSDRDGRESFLDDEVGASMATINHTYDRQYVVQQIPNGSFYVSHYFATPQSEPGAVVSAPTQALRFNAANAASLQRHLQQYKRDHQVRDTVPVVKEQQQ